MQRRTDSPTPVLEVPTDGTVKLSVNVSADVGQHLRRIAFEERLSESSIVQIALSLMFEKIADTATGDFLREQGASLRRGMK